MHRVRQIAAVLAALLMFAALPAAAVAQSSGEDQYTDPLAPDSGGGSNGGGSGDGGGGGGSNAPAPGPAPAQVDPAQQATPAQADTNSLPRTGFPVALLVISGGVLLASGLALRRRTT